MLQLVGDLSNRVTCGIESLWSVKSVCKVPPTYVKQKLVVGEIPT